ncbi:MAG TPA: hypothetical protein VNI82_00145, partial [Candidatus Nitrosotenuis sp.]|nr:hypothetical protein [Candidatus Nitrosotenuis sp.]
NYVTLALAFAGLYFIAKGSQGLYSTLKPRGKTSNSQSFYGLAGTVALTSVYTWLVVAQGYATPGTAPYFLPTWLLIITFVIPYVFAWCMGIWAALCLRRYYTAVKGTIYKEALNNLYKGVAGIVVVSIFLQSLTSVPGLVNRLDLTPLLIVVYVLIATYAIGYGLVANGAKKLKLIEIA